MLNFISLYLGFYSLVFLLRRTVGFGMGLDSLSSTLVGQAGEEFALTDAFQVQVTVVIFTVGVGETNARCEVKCDATCGEHGWVERVGCGKCFSFAGKN